MCVCEFPGRILSAHTLIARLNTRRCSFEKLLFSNPVDMCVYYALCNDFRRGIYHFFVKIKLSKHVIYERYIILYRSLHQSIFFLKPFSSLWTSPTHFTTYTYVVYLPGLNFLLYTRTLTQTRACTCSYV